MRTLGVAALAALALSVAACSDSGSIGGAPPPSEEGAASAAAAPDTFTVEIFAHEDERIYLVTDADDGTRVAARAAGGASALMEPADARTLLTQELQALDSPDRERLALRLPGFSFSIRTDEMQGDNARIAIEAGGKTVEVDAADAGGSENAVVRVAGLNAEEARKFIVEIEDLEPGVQQQMLDALDL